MFSVILPLPVPLFLTWRCQTSAASCFSLCMSSKDAIWAVCLAISPSWRNKNNRERELHQSIPSNLMEDITLVEWFDWRNISISQRISPSSNHYQLLFSFLSFLCNKFKFWTLSLCSSFFFLESSALLACSLWLQLKLFCSPRFFLQFWTEVEK